MAVKLPKPRQAGRHTFDLTAVALRLPARRLVAGRARLALLMDVARRARENIPAFAGRTPALDRPVPALVRLAVGVMFGRPVRAVRLTASAARPSPPGERQTMAVTALLPKVSVMLHGGVAQVAPTRELRPQPPGPFYILVAACAGQSVTIKELAAKVPPLTAVRHALAPRQFCPHTYAAIVPAVVRVGLAAAAGVVPRRHAVEAGRQGL